MKWRSYQQARKFAHSLKLKNRDGWNQYCKTDKKPDDIPKDVASYYKKQETWTTWGDFLGTGYISTAKRKYKSFKDVAEFAQKIGLMLTRLERFLPIYRDIFRIFTIQIIERGKRNEVEFIPAS